MLMLFVQHRGCGAEMWIGGILLLVLLGAGILPADSSDADVMVSFLKGLKNGDVLGWSGNNPCAWTKHIRCEGDSVIGISLESIGLVGTVTNDLNKLSNLQYLGLQFNSFYGPLPSLAGLKGLVRAYLNSNQFSSIPPDFFTGLDSLETLYLDYNHLNAPDGWTLPAEVQQLGKLVNLSLTNTNLTGPLPSFLGTMPSLKVLNLAYNKLSGGIPASFINSALVQLELNNMDAPSLSGPIDVVGTMTSLSQLWLQGNRFTGPIPVGLSNAVALRNLKLNDNSLVGPIPANLSKLPLEVFSVDNNQLMGPIPVMAKGTQFTYAGANQFCQSQPGLSCSPEVSALIDFIVAAGYPSAVVSSWTGNDPCRWTGITCTGTQVTRLLLRASNLVGTISPAIAELKGLEFLTLSNNNLTGPLPPALTTMASLNTLDVSNNNLTGPMLTFSSKVSFLHAGNPLLNAGSPSRPTSSPSPAPPKSSVNQPPPQQTPGSPPSVVSPPTPSTPATPSSRQPAVLGPPSKSPSSKFRVVVIALPVAAGLSLGVLAGVLVLLCCRQKAKQQPTGSHPRSPLINTMSVHPRNSTSDPDMVKVEVSRNDGRSSASGNGNSSRGSDVVVEAGSFVISIQVLRQATGNFSEVTILGRGGFGVVYKGVLHDGTTIAVKRMESSVVSSKGISEFQAEIAVLTKVRHRHLVGLLGYCIDGNEKLLVYEYLPNGTLSQHLFEHQSLGWKPLDWKKRLVIALDVAKGLEYLHTLAHMSFIHRDLKPSNILLDEDYRAKVSDFGLVKLAPEGKYSVETRLAGTFGYLAPEYAVTGRVTTKADVFSFGVVLMELITGRKALDDTQPEENMHLVSWFRRTNQSKESLAQNVDPALEGIEEKIESLWTVAELARHCTAREPYQRPDMGHAVNVLAPLVKQWKPTDTSCEETRGIDLNMSLPQALKQWQASELSDLDDSRNSLPTRPVGFADSFGSADAR